MLELHVVRIAECDIAPPVCVMVIICFISLNMGLFGISDQHKYKHKNYIFITHGGRISSLFPNPISCRSSEDVTANLGAHVTSVTIVANNENTTVSIETRNTNTYEQMPHL